MRSTLEQRIRQTLSAGADSAALDAALALVLAHFGAQMGTIHRFDATDGHLHLVAASRGIPERVLAQSRLIPLGKGIAGETAQSRRPVSLCNLQTDQAGIARPEAKATGLGGSICIPIFDGSDVAGTLGIGCLGERTFTATETDELLAAGRAMATALAAAH